LPSKIPQQEASVDRHRTGGMTAIAVLNIVFGGLVILNGLFQLLGSLALMSELSRLGVFQIPMARLTFSLLVLATGIVGLIAGIGMFALHPWARALSFVFGGLLLVSAVFSFFIVPIIATIGTYDIGSLGAYDLARLVIFSSLYVVLPVIFSVVLFIVFNNSAWKTTFAKV
jgi:hypothetical protein